MQTCANGTNLEKRDSGRSMHALESILGSARPRALLVGRDPLLERLSLVIRAVEQT